MQPEGCGPSESTWASLRHSRRVFRRRGWAIRPDHELHSKWPVEMTYPCGAAGASQTDVGQLPVGSRPAYAYVRLHQATFAHRFIAVIARETQRVIDATKIGQRDQTRPFPNAKRFAPAPKAANQNGSVICKIFAYLGAHPIHRKIFKDFCQIPPVPRV